MDWRALQRNQGRAKKINRKKIILKINSVGSLPRPPNRDPAPLGKVKVCLHAEVVTFSPAPELRVSNCSGVIEQH